MSKDRIILINYSSPPEALYYFFPDNGLALLASVLQAEGYEPLILDYVTTENFRKFFTPEIKSMLEEIKKSGGFSYQIEELKKLTDLKKVFFRMIKEHELTIAHEIIEHIKIFRPSIIGFKLWETFGIHGSSVIAGEIKKYYPEIITVAGGPHVVEFSKPYPGFHEKFRFPRIWRGWIPLLELLKYAGGRSNLKSIPRSYLS